MRSPLNLMRPRKEKSLVGLVSLLGICAVVYGMAKENDAIFVIGLLLVIAGYILIRRRLKASAREKNGTEM